MRKIVFLICVALGLACVQAKASKIALSADRTEVTPDGEVLAFVSLSVCDAAGRVVPRSNHLTSSLRHPKVFVEEFGDALMPCHQHGFGVNIPV